MCETVLVTMHFASDPGERKALVRVYMCRNVPAVLSLHQEVVFCEGGIVAPTPYEPLLFAFINTGVVSVSYIIIQHCKWSYY